MRYEPCHDRDLWVTLTDEEIDRASLHGIAMRRFSKANNHKDKKGFGFRKPTEAVAIRMQALAAVSEAAVAKAMHMKAKLLAQVYGVADLPDNIQVRLLTHEYYGLRVYPDDNDHWKVVGIVITAGNERKPYRIPGWILAGHAKQNDSWVIAPNGGPPMWAVPQSELRDIRELIYD